MEAQDGVVIEEVVIMTVVTEETDTHHHQAEGMRCRHPTSVCGKDTNECWSFDIVLMF